MKYHYINIDKLTDEEKELLGLLDEMSEVKFVFWKKEKGGSGEVRREARGTRNTDYIPREKWPSHPMDDVGKKINFFDLDKQEWRSMTVGKLIKICGDASQA